MVPFNLQLELSNKPTTLSVEQLDQVADRLGFMRYHIRTFNSHSVIYVNIEDNPLEAGEVTGFTEEDVFSPEEVKTIAEAIREHNSSGKLNFDQMHFDF
jgi:hypothetical protein